MLAVEAVAFNHNPGAATHDALNIRRNASQTVHIPEWRRFISVNPEDSPAAYALGPTGGNPLTIIVWLRSTDPSLAFVEVRSSGMWRRGRLISSTVRRDRSHFRWSAP